ncbi:tRNA glutamyl-Q(34) synthetase GluQRS [Psychrobacter sp. 16-MNA-CIBAN-0192]|uniref:tRNA glutamyl-Q(34) synthetase GluQRS n=1 Tax=Psychrobacter sp. 16-MNA-CIBAN-0192 TaxID=3140448 RepID=UPI00332FD188
MTLTHNPTDLSLTKRQPVGRFAPSPTGELHLGSLTTALASFCHIKSLGGMWRLRIEDTDTERCDQQFSEQIMIDLEALGLHWDGDVIYQSERIDIYNDYLFSSLRPLTYGCQCSRKSLAHYWGQQNGQDKYPQDSHKQQVAHQRYPRCCVDAELDWQTHKLRLQLPNHRIGFIDGIQGVQWQNPQHTLGDMVVRRQDGMINYILAASIDDGLQDISHVMRGLDILPLTAAQISIMHASKLPSIDHWYHLPLICHADGQKLSKQNLAQPIDTQHPSALLKQALQLLQQPSVDIDTPARMLQQAIAQWDNTPLQGKQALNGSEP